MPVFQNHSVSVSRKTLTALHALLTFYAPALLVIGVDVRQLTWMGGVGGSVKGDVAKRVIENCLALQLHVTQDWGARAEYIRSMAIALLSWTTWHSKAPGCCFSEEPCEALLSRMVGRIRHHRQLSTFDDLLHLFVTLPPAASEARPTSGGLRQEMVLTMAFRVMRLVREAGVLPYARLTGAKKGVWDAVMPDVNTMPTIPDRAALQRSLVPVLERALTTFMRAVRLPAATVAEADICLPIRGQPAGGHTADTGDSGGDSVPSDAGNDMADDRDGDADEDRADARSLGMASDGGSLYNPPETVDGEEQSAACTSDWGSSEGCNDWDVASDGTFGSLGEVVTGAQSEWLALTGMDLVDEL